jgi:N-dimethylarginine dimethylaminohydrolase
MARFRHGVRVPESTDRAAFLAARGAEVVHAESYLEGGDVTVTNDCVYLGYGFRSERRSAELLGAHFERTVVALRLVDPRLYHLDMALTVLPDGTALVCREALAAESLRALERSPGVREVVGVSVEDALSMCLNVVPVGDTLVGGNVSRRVSAIIAARGFRQDLVPLDQFHRAGGGAACLVSAVHAPRDEQRADEAVAA